MRCKLDIRLKQPKKKLYTGIRLWRVQGVMRVPPVFVVVESGPIDVTVGLSIRSEVGREGRVEVG